MQPQTRLQTIKQDIKSMKLAIYNSLLLVNFQRVKEILNSSRWDFEYIGQHTERKEAFIDKLNNQKWTLKAIEETYFDVKENYPQEWEDVFTHSFTDEIDIEELVEHINKSFALFCGHGLARSVTNSQEREAFSTYIFTPLI